MDGRPVFEKIGISFHHTDKVKYFPKVTLENFVKKVKSYQITTDLFSVEEIYFVISIITF